MFDDFGNGPGGPMVSGKWINKKTGETIVIRDSIIDGDKMILISNKGNIDFNIFSRDYIQASDEVYDESGKVIKTETVKTSEVVDKPQRIDVSSAPSTISLDEEFDENGTVIVPTQHKQEKTISNFDLIDKIFKKTQSKPTASLKIDWADFPQNELSMLVNYFDVELEDIAQYIGKYLINDDLLNEALFDFLSRKMKDIK